MTEEKPETAHASYDDEIDLFDYVEVIVRRRWLIIWGILLFVAGGFALVPVGIEYEAEANVLVLGEEHVDPSSGRVVSSPIQMNVLKSYRVGQWVLDEKVPAANGGSVDSTALRDILGAEMTARRFLKTVGQISKFEYSEDVVTITITHEDSSIAAAVANGYVEALIRYYKEEGQKQVRLESELIESRLGEVGSDLRVAEDSLYAFKRRYPTLPEDPEEHYRLSRELSWIQQLVGARTGLYRNLLNQREQTRLRSQLPTPTFEVLNYVSAEDAASTGFGLRQRLGLSAGAGLVVFVFLAFILEFLQRNRQTGRMDPILNELRRDRFFRLFVRK